MVSLPARLTGCNFELSEKDDWAASWLKKIKQKVNIITKSFALKGEKEIALPL